MELKLDFWFTSLLNASQLLIAPLWNWNHRSGSRWFSRRKLLIAPLWNWNRVADGYLSQGGAFNRTFMELKRVCRTAAVRKPALLIAPLWNWNSSRVLTHSHSGYLLIAPLWNWNTLTPLAFRRLARLLIAPLWNWNFSSEFSIEKSSTSFNRTFMELKHFGFQGMNERFTSF